MSSKSFENYTKLAAMRNASDTEVAGRYNFQNEAERRIIPDIISKLEIRADDELLEIGCGPGNLLIPLSYLVRRAAAIDNATVLTRLSQRNGFSGNIDLYEGDFLEMALPERRFSKILIYSVVQYVDSESSARRFVSRALDLLAPGGRLLMGDLPNEDSKRRWAASEKGRRAAKEWRAKISAAGAHPLPASANDESLVRVGDALVFGLMSLGREIGYESYLLAQPADLPFGQTREDILFKSRK